MLVTWQTNYDSSRLFLFDFKVCALMYGFALESILKGI